MNEPININEASFDKAVLQSPVPTVVDFWASWCGPCKMIAPVLDEIARENEGRFRVAKVNIDDDPALMQRYGVRAVPTLLFFNRGELKEQLVGGVAKKAVIDRLNNLARDEAAA
jgi:thioredoxin 1